MNVKIPNIPTYILNIPSRIERKQNALLQAKKLGIKKPIIFPAITPDDLVIPEKELDNPLNKINRFTAGCFAARASFLAIIDHAIYTKKPYFLYMEDDVCMVDTAKTELELILKLLPKDWDVLLLSVYHYDKPDLINNHVVKANGTWAMNLAMFNKSSYGRLFKLVSEGFRGADLTVGMTKWLGSDLNVYAARYNIGYETTDMKSDIINRVETKELPIDVFTHIEITPIEIALAQNPTLNITQIWEEINAKTN